MNKRISVGFLSFVMGGIVAAFIGFSLRPDIGTQFSFTFLTSTDGPQQGISSRNGGEVSTPPNSNSGGPTFDARRTLDEITGLDSAFNEYSAVYRLAYQSNEQQIKELLDATDFISERTVAIFAFDTFLFQYVNLNPEGAYAYIKTRDKRKLYDFLRRLFRNWSALDSDSAMNFAESLEGRERTIAASSILSAGNAGSIAEAQAFAKRVGITLVGHGPTIYESSSESEVTFDKVFASLIENGEYENHRTLERVALAWARIDPQVVWDTVSASSLSDERKLSVAQEIYPDLVLRDPMGTLAMMIEFGIENFRNRVIDAIQRVARTDHDLALHTAMEVDDQHLRSNLVAATLDAIAQKNPILALTYVHQYEEEVGDSVIFSVARQVALSSPAEALEILGPMNDSVGKMLAIEHIFKLWSDRDVLESLAWLESEESGLSRETGARVALSVYMRQHPQQAVEWALTHTDNEKFDNLAQYIVNQVAMGNPDSCVPMLKQILDAGGTPNSYHVARSMIDLGRTQDAIDIVEDLPENLQSIHISAVFGYLATTDEASIDYLGTLDDRHIASGAIALLADEEVASLYRQEILDSIPDPEQRQRIAQMAIGSIRIDR